MVREVDEIDYVGGGDVVRVVVGVDDDDDDDDVVVDDDDDQASLYPSSPELRPDQLLLRHQGTLEDTLEDEDDVDVEEAVLR